MTAAMASEPANLPTTAAYAWSRYRRVMGWLMAVMIALMLVALRLAGQHAASGSIRRYVLAALSVGLVMLASSLAMGLLYILRKPGIRAAGGSPPPARRQSDAPE
jgi:hypothetical protein